MTKCHSIFLMLSLAIASSFSWFTTSAHAQSSDILDINGRSVSSFLSRDHTIVIGFDGNSQGQLKTLIKQAVAELGDEVDSASYDSGFVPLKGFQILFVYDARADIRSGFSEETSKYNGPGKRIIRSIVVKKSPAKIRDAIREIDPTLRQTINQEIKGLIDQDDIRIVSLFKSEWSVGKSEGHRPSTGRRVIKRAIRSQGHTYISFSNGGKSARFMQSVFTNSGTGLQVAILNPNRQITKRWVGMIPPMDVIEFYAHQKGIEVDPSSGEQIGPRNTYDLEYNENGENPFDALITAAVEYDYPGLKVSVSHLKSYTDNLSECTGAGQYPSAKPLQAFYRKAFMKINHDVQAMNKALASNDYFTLMSGRKPLLHFVDTSTVLLRKYYAVQAMKFTAGTEGLSQADKELHLTLRAVYEQVAEMLKLAPKESVPHEVEWQGRDLRDYENDPYWDVILSAILLGDTDLAYCGALL